MAFSTGVLPKILTLCGNYDHTYPDKVNCCALPPKCCLHYPIVEKYHPSERLRSRARLANRGMQSGMVFDEDYLARLRARDPETEHHFVQHFSIVMHYRLRRRLRSRELIADIKQETFYRVVRFIHSGKRLDHPEHLGAFVQSTCHNVMLELLRGDARHAPTDGAPELPDTRVDVESALVTEAGKRAVRDVLAALPAKDQKILSMVFLEESRREDICKTFNVETNYLRVLLHRAKGRFREALNDSRPGRPN